MKLFNWFKPIVFPADCKFSLGQKVATMITSEVKNSIIGTGIIIGYSHKAVSYWAFSNTPSDWFKVEMSNGDIITYPQERLEDLSEYIKKWDALIENNKDKIGQKGFSFETFDKVQSQLSNAKSYL